MSLPFPEAVADASPVFSKLRCHDNKKHRATKQQAHTDKQNGKEEFLQRIGGSYWTLTRLKTASQNCPTGLGEQRSTQQRMLHTFSPKVRQLRRRSDGPGRR